VWEGDGGRVALQFISIGAQEGDTRWRMARRRAERGDGGSSVLRKKKEGAGWAMGQRGRVGRMPLGPAWRENDDISGLDRKDDWAKMGNRLRISFSKFYFKDLS
jgi:hypothetical protein